MRIAAWIITLLMVGTPVLAAEKPAKDPDLAASPRLGRKPASVAQGASPGLQMIVPPPSAQKAPRWRLMGTCRSDVGTQQNLGGIGYGNCQR